MKKKSKRILEETQKLIIKNKELQQQGKQHLLKAMGTINLIKTGNIDALVIPDEKNLKVYTETTSDKTYRILIEKMNEGAITIDKDGTILYCNSSFANMLNLPLQKVIGTIFKKFIDAFSKEHFEALLKKVGESNVKDEIDLITNDGKVVSALISITVLKIDTDFVLSIILTDLTDRKKNEEELKRRAGELEQKNLELESANKELAIQNEEKEKRAAELIIANEELAFQNNEKEKRAAELIIANKELAYQNNEKEKRAAELSVANKDLTTFTFVSSHDLQEPLRKIKNFVSVLLEEEEKKLSDEGKNYLQRMYETANGMQVLIEDLLIYAGTKDTDRKFEKTDLTIIVEEVKKDFKEAIQKKKATIEIARLCETNIIRFQFRQLLQNLFSNSLKFSKPHEAPHIIIKSEIVNGSKLINVRVNDIRPNDSFGREGGQEKLLSEIDYCHINYTDNGIGFDPQYNERIFEVFQRLNEKEEYEGTGMGLAICKRIVENHNGIITATGELNKGARFDIYIPVA